MSEVLMELTRGGGDESHPVLASDHNDREPASRTSKSYDEWREHFAAERLQSCMFWALLPILFSLPPIFSSIVVTWTHCLSYDPFL